MGYNFRLIFDGKTVSIEKDGKTIDVYGDGFTAVTQGCGMYRVMKTWHLILRMKTCVSV